MPYLAQVAVGKRPYLNVYGNDYATPHGTGIRDYVHVEDLAQGHVAAVQALIRNGESFTVNLGTGQGHSVLQVVRAFEQASGQPVPYQFAPAVRAMWRIDMRIRRLPIACWAGAPRVRLRIRALMPGVGS